MVCLPHSEKTTILVHSHPGVDRQALRPFSLLHNVRGLSFCHLQVGRRMTVLADVGLSIDSGPTASEEPPTFIPTLTIPIEGCDGPALDSGMVSCHRCPSARVSSMSVNIAV
jgi:hypothetical protein